MDIGKDLVAASSTPLILAILADDELYGYAIVKRVDELSDGTLQWTEGMLYPLLHRLERQGYIEGRWGSAETGRKRKYYRITTSGRRIWRTSNDSGRRSMRRCGTYGVRSRSWPARRLSSRRHKREAEVVTMSGEGALEGQIAEWRSYLLRRQALREVDVAELEDHLRGQVERLMDVGLAEEEAFLVAVKRLGAVDALSQEFAREHSDRLWRQLMATPGTAEEGVRSGEERRSSCSRWRSRPRC
jgi:PadR family transcriptional regulator, regulatory protein PadR